MEYVEGQSLEKMLEKQGRLPWPEVLDIALQDLRRRSGTSTISGVIHRDIKPPNILRTAAGEIKLTDFGIARIFASRHLTATGGVVGTAEFLSPEQAAGKPVTKRSDLYSLGVVLYMLLTGRPPFVGTSFSICCTSIATPSSTSRAASCPICRTRSTNSSASFWKRSRTSGRADCLVLARKLENIRRKLRAQGQPDGAGRRRGHGGREPRRPACRWKAGPARRRS